MTTARRRRATGAECTSDGVHFRVFAPDRARVAVELAAAGASPTRTVALAREADGHFSGLVPGLRPSARYGYRLDDDPRVYPDPASRFQPDGPHGLSEVIDPSSFRWTDSSWKGVELRGQVIYELHVGTFTEEGTFDAAARHLGELRDLGVTLIELMPLAEFPGRFGWGYDGVDLYAPTRLYGRPDDLRAFVDQAHAASIGVILDVVYNHFGPSGNYLHQFTKLYFTDRYENEWGEAIDFESSPGVREHFVENAAYWIDEFHLDGLRLDATQSIHDVSNPHILAEITAIARAAAGARTIVVVAENERQDAKLARPPEAGGYGIDALWNDDLHHAAWVAATGRREAYYQDTKGTPQELVSAIKWGYLYQGQRYPWQGKRRGTPSLDLPATAFVSYLQNHDQVANSASGLRLDRSTTPGRARALTALFLLAPATPMLFQGQEFGSSKPFLYFADHDPALAELVQTGRVGFLGQFPSLRDPSVVAALPAPHDALTFARCKLDFGERTRNRTVFDLHKDLLRLRRSDPIFSAQRNDWLFGAVIAPEAFALRFATGTGRDRLVLVNLGADLEAGGIAEPLLAPPDENGWRIAFSTEDLRYGGGGTPSLGDGFLPVPGHACLVLEPAATAEAKEVTP